jgi:hypothetical protein
MKTQHQKRKITTDNILYSLSGAFTGLFLAVCFILAAQ